MMSKHKSSPMRTRTLLAALHAVAAAGLLARQHSWAQAGARLVYTEAALDWRTTALQNAAVWLSLYPTAYLLFYHVCRERWRGHKYNPRAPDPALLLREVGRSVRGVAICTAADIWVQQLYANNALPLPSVEAAVPWSLRTAPLEEVPPLSVLAWITPMYLFADCHFYWTHRLLHVPVLYRNIHRVHHESYNPNPFSGLSMHAAESAIYFSAAPMLALVAPLWVFRALVLGLLVFPLNGHIGYGSWADDDANHYLHHARFTVNFGSSPLWDRLCGTGYVHAAGAALGAEAGRQARLAGMPRG